MASHFVDSVACALNTNEDGFLRPPGRLDTYARCIRHRLNFGHIFQGKKCILWAGKYGNSTGLFCKISLAILTYDGLN